jgi:hypothetical protein
VSGYITRRYLTKKETQMHLSTGKSLRTMLTVTALVGASLGFSAGAEAHYPGPYIFKGALTTHQVGCATLCTEGALTGDIKGKLQFTMSTITQTGTPNVSTYVGVNVITNSYGTLTGTDYGVWNLVTGEFTDYTEFTGGTGIYAGVKGSMSIMGVFDPVAGTGASNWRASLDWH